MLIGLGQAYGAAPPERNPHDHFRQAPQCPKCHIRVGAGIDTSGISTSSIDLCLECHRAEERGRTHPLKAHPDGKFGKMNIPPEYLLGDGEHIVCLTCHTAHGPFLSQVRAFASQMPETPKGGDGAAPSYRTFFLRRSNPDAAGAEPLCEGCHKVP